MQTSLANQIIFLLLSSSSNHISDT